MDAQSIINQLLTPEGRADRYPLYTLVHELGPAAPAGEGLVMVGGYEAVKEALRNPGLGTDITMASLGVDLDEHPSLAMLNRSILYANPPHHGRMRSPISPLFTARRVAAMEKTIAEHTDTLLDALAEAGARPVDFMDAFAFPLPARVICELVGVPDGDRSHLHGLAIDMMAALELMADPSGLETADRAALEIGDYFTHLAEARRADPRDDLVTALVKARERGALETDEELVANLTQVLLAGLETTTYLLGNGLQLLLEHPQVMAGLREGTVDVADFVEEVLRYDTPGQVTHRVAMADGISIEGVPVPAGSQVLLLLGAANRDPARYDDPDRFDPGRQDIQPLSFSGGAHYCLGAVLARSEATIAFSRLISRFPALALAPDAEPTRQDRLILRAHETLPVVVAPPQG
ncbi:cytochrome P450 [Streptomyces sp. SS7]|uniref:cytochrome P450 n=1 Tax=Streptomyces sp. SS7 TaxID=3108485 RepID=UPI0030ED4DF9